MVSPKEILSFLSLAILVSICVALDIEKSPARVYVSEDRSIEDGYKVEIEANGEIRKLNLSPMESIWAEDAQFLIMDTNEKGEEILEYKTIEKKMKVYHDPSTGSILSVKEGKINGILDSDYMVYSEEDGEHYVKKSSKKVSDEYDYAEVAEIPQIYYKNLPLSAYDSVSIPFTNIQNRQTIPKYTPEITVIVDSKLKALLGTDAKIYEYLTIFWNGVQRRFATIKNPIITLKLVGSVIMRNSTMEPFITNQIVNGSKVHINSFYDLARWVYSNIKTLPPHDIIYLQTDRDMTDSKYDNRLAGIAYINGACNKNSSYNSSRAVAMGEDRGAFYDGVHTAAHEIAHTLGSPHDNDTASGTGNCSWNDGYIMSYLAGVKNHLFFSNCSINKMSIYLKSSAAACVKNNLNSTVPAGVYNSTKLPGHVLTMVNQCKKLTGLANATVPSVSPESFLCYNLICQVSLNNTTYFVFTNTAAAEGALCPSTKRCYNGECI